MEIDHPLARLEKKIGANWPNMLNARQRTTETFKKINDTLGALSDDRVPLLSKENSSEVSVIAFGSLARQEFTQGSDLDWTLLIDGQVDPDHLKLQKKVEQQLESLCLKSPGQEGTFGDMVFSHDLVHQIGGDEDTNRNTTRRCLMLLESVPLGGNDLAYSSVIKAILLRYLNEDPSFQSKKGQGAVPRFLLNDFARYWRTMAVDFAYKRRKRFGKGAALRVIKLRVSRKLLFASGLLSCFACKMKLANQESAPCPGNANECIQCLSNFLKKTPQEIVALYLLHFLDSKNGEEKDKTRELATQLFSNYDLFLGILEDQAKREHLDSLDLEQFETDEAFKEARELSREFSKNIQTLFFKLDLELTRLTQEYGVF